jgi:polysaccharide export outer membrane protein
MRFIRRRSALRLYLALVMALAFVNAAVITCYSQSYVVGAADRLAVSVWGYKDLSVEAVVLPDGTISLPLIGQVEVAGLDLRHVLERLSKRYAEFIRDPRVNVVVKDLGTITVSVVGEVNKPGPVTLIRESRALDAIAAAGGLATGGSTNQAQIVRATGKVIPLEDLQATLRGDEQANPLLQSGDVLVVKEDVINVATVTGQVNKPGVVVHLQQAPTLLRAISLAGGLTERAGLEGEIIRKSGETIPANLGALLLRGDLSQNVPLQPGDLIIVPEGPSQVFVVGGVKNPGAYRVTGDVSALEALSMAGGVAAGNTNGKVVLYHRPAGSASERGQNSAAVPHNGTQSATPTPGGTVDTLRLQQILRGDDSAANAKLHPGDVLYVQESTAPSILGQIILPILQGVANFVYLFR